MFGKKKNKEGFKLNINKEQAEEEYKEYVERYRKAYADLESKGVFGKSE